MNFDIFELLLEEELMEKATFNTRKGENNHPAFTPGSYYATGPPVTSELS